MKPDGKRTKQLPEKKRQRSDGKKKLWMSAKVTGECTISYNSDLNPTKKKKKKQQREKLHSNGHETIDFIEKDCWKSKHNFSRSWQVLCLIIVFRAAAEFILLSLYLCDTSHQLAKKQKNIKTTLHHARQFLECENINIAKLLERLFISCLFSVFN